MVVAWGKQETAPSTSCHKPFCSSIQPVYIVLIVTSCSVGHKMFLVETGKFWFIPIIIIFSLC